MGIIENASALIGRWTSVDLPYFAYNFLHDGTGYYSLSNGKKDFIYKDLRTSVVIRYISDTVPSTFEYSIKDNMLIIKDSFGNDVKYKKYEADTECLSESVCEDGGTERSTGHPIAINSDQLVRFECEASYFSAESEEETELFGKVYKLLAVVYNNTVNCYGEWYDRFGDGNKYTFTADKSFLEKLQKLVFEYGFASHNGHYSKTCGLPDMYGAKIDIKYASGESIYAYDNGDNFIPLDAVKRLIKLFEMNIEG